MNIGALFSQYKNILYVGVAVVLVGGAGFYLLSQEPEPVDTAGGTGALNPQRAARIAQLEQELLSRLLELQAIKLNDDLFGSLSFQSLIDFHQPILPQPLGRDNPFAPVDITIEDIEQQRFETENIVEDQNQEAFEAETTPARTTPAPANRPQGGAPSQAPEAEESAPAAPAPPPPDDTASQQEETKNNTQEETQNDQEGAPSAPPPPPPPPAPGSP